MVIQTILIVIYQRNIKESMKYVVLLVIPKKIVQTLKTFIIKDLYFFVIFYIIIKQFSQISFLLHEV